MTYQVPRWFFSPIFFFGVRSLFLSAAQPTDQGDESVVLLVVVIVVVVVGTIFQFPMYSFWGVKRQNFVSKGV